VNGPTKTIIVSTYPPEHCGVGRDAFQVVQELRTLRPVEVLANQVNEPPLPDPTVHMAWRKNDPLYAFRIAHAVRRASGGERCVVHVFHHFLLYGGPLTIPEFPVLIALLRLQGHRVVVQYQSVIDPSEPDLAGFVGGPGAGRLVGYALRQFYRGTERLSDATVVCTPSMRRLLIEAYGLSRDRVWLVPVGWQLRPPPAGGEDSKARLGLAGKKVVLFHGFLDPTKGLEILFGAFARLSQGRPDLVLILAGEPGPGLARGGAKYLEDLRSLSVGLGIASRVRFTGFLTDADIDVELAAADLIALPYTMRFSHGGSAVLSRVASSGKPLVASRISRFADELVDGDSALLVPPGDSERLATAIEELLTSPAEAERLGRALRALAQRRTWRVSAQLLDEKVYPEATGSKSSKELAAL
jgi:glycosyltransferase involved in cell wall biosynthesis